MSAEARARLAEGQAALTAALLDGAPPPPGFDAARVRACAEALACKRAREVASGWPALAALPDFATKFAAFARATPLARGGPLEDGRRFARALRRARALSDAALVELLAVELRGGPWPLRAARREAGGFVVGLRLPLVGERWWGLT